MPKEYASLDVEIIHISGGAVLCNDGDQEGWIPKSVIEDWDDDSYSVGDQAELEVEEWFAEKEGWI